jgi:hypothetical protein
MSVGLPVIITTSNGLAPYFALGGLQESLSLGTPADIAERIDRVLSEPAAWNSHSRLSRSLAQTTFSVDHVALELERNYSCVPRGTAP